MCRSKHTLLLLLTQPVIIPNPLYNKVYSCVREIPDRFWKKKTHAGAVRLQGIRWRVVLLRGSDFGGMPPQARCMAIGKRKKGGTAMNDGYDTLIITFSEPIEVLDGMFEDIDTWGVDSLKKWVDDYESTRFTPIDGYTAVITSEYNMQPVREWLEHYMPIAEMKEL